MAENQTFTNPAEAGATEEDIQPFEPDSGTYLGLFQGARFMHGKEGTRNAGKLQCIFSFLFSHEQTDWPPEVAEEVGGEEAVRFVTTKDKAYRQFCRALGVPDDSLLTWNPEDYKNTQVLMEIRTRVTEEDIYVNIDGITPA